MSELDEFRELRARPAEARRIVDTLAHVLQSKRDVWQMGDGSTRRMRPVRQGCEKEIAASAVDSTLALLATLRWDSVQSLLRQYRREAE